MTLNVDITPEHEGLLIEEAEKRGLNPHQYAEWLIQQRFASSPTNSLWDTLPSEEWKRVTRGWIESHRDGRPRPSHVPLTREEIYDGHP